MNRWRARCESSDKRRRYAEELLRLGYSSWEVVPPRPACRPRIAVDVQVAFRAFAEVKAGGADVVYEAGVSEPDHIWVAGAVATGAHAIVSPDWDAGLLCLWTRPLVGWVRFPAESVQGGWRAHAPLILGILRRWGWLP